MHCYCANYYGAVNCQNKVSNFGQRCKLCIALNEGRSAKDPSDPFKITSNDYAYDSDVIEDDDSSQDDEESQRGRSRERSKSSSK
ncbi:uncharacterized protein F4822DRAFT_441202 [Hypoxylon trugodes]|uniref:uncharacterized protein n=1 Tax=Hypoxylon trugodes TaxID=326681 RepID=UPI002191A321|nr:uncharacterized protein F4822DRAFT_441202 [Hypoxylon trugodes]KAI1392088.1 hypothetical protein F4822DRAFT_441202 [Hypoxylon trugodes]